MRITVEVTITAYRADGTQVQVTNGARKQTGDNPRFAGDEASEVVDAAAKAALTGFRAAVDPADNGDQMPVGPVSDLLPEPPPAGAAWFKEQRAYVINAMDIVGVPLDSDAARIRSMLLDAGLEVNADDAEMESFQALRRQTRMPSEGAQAVIRVLDRLGAADKVSVSGAKAIARQHQADIWADDAQWAEAVRIRNARKEPEQ